MKNLKNISRTHNVSNLYTKVSFVNGFKAYINENIAFELNLLRVDFKEHNNSLQTK